MSASWTGTCSSSPSTRATILWLSFLSFSRHWRSVRPEIGDRSAASSPTAKTVGKASHGGKLR